MLPLINALRFGMTHSAEISTTTAFFLPSLHSRRQKKPRVRRTSCGFTKRFAGECGRQAQGHVCTPTPRGVPSLSHR